MAIYKYTGYDKQGAASEGSIDADSQRDAALKIRTKGILPTDISETAAAGRKSILRRFSPLTLADITRRMSILMSAGVPLIEAISALANEQKGDWKNLLIDIKDRLAGGSSFARALSAHTTIFPDFYTGMIAAGETSGKLSDVLVRLADFLEKEIEIRNRIRTALVYPAFMACVSTGIILFLFTFVIPKITKIFEESSAALPVSTIILLWISTFMKKFWWLVAIFVTGASFMFKKLYHSKREFFDALLLREPTGIMMGLYMLRFTLTMGFLLSGGLPIMPSMKLTSRATGNVVLEKRILAAENLVSQGAALSSSLEGFPPTLTQIISTGEKTGSLPIVLEKTAASYEAEFDRKLQRLISILEPSLILIMGLVVGFIVVSVLMPIFEINEMMK